MLLANGPDGVGICWGAMAFSIDDLPYHDQGIGSSTSRCSHRELERWKTENLKKEK